MSDPAREDSAQTVTKAHNMGVAVKMITGDEKNIAKYILKEIGLKDNVITGKDFSEKENKDSENTTSEHQKYIIKYTEGFSNVKPLEKLKIVEA